MVFLYGLFRVLLSLSGGFHMTKENKIPVRLAALLFVLMTVGIYGCSGTDEVEPSVALSSPDAVFINVTGQSEFVRLQGTAEDNVKITLVEGSLDGGNTFPFSTTDLPLSASVDWDLSLPAGGFASPATTVVIRATDGEGNTALSSASVVPVYSGNAPADLDSVITSASPGDVIFLSSGSGSAYSTTLSITQALTLVGHGFGNAVTAGGYSAQGMTPATVLSADSAEPFIVQTRSDLDLSNIRFAGAAVGLNIEDNDIDSTDLTVTVNDCLFEGQGAWGIYAAKIVPGDTIDQLLLNTLYIGVDASQAASNDGGGIYLGDATYNLEYMDVRGAVASPGYYAGVFITGGSGTVSGSFFDDNAVAIWASGGAPVIASNSIDGSDTLTTAGINLTGGPAYPEIRSNEIAYNSGYGLRIGGEMQPRVRSNIIRNNDGAGIVIDFEGSAVDLVSIDLGTTSDSGSNDLYENDHPSSVLNVQAYVSTSTPIGRIPAERNYWGFATPEEVNLVIIDGNDSGGSPDRGYLDPTNFWFNKQN
jgi:hypothetical protein